MNYLRDIKMKKILITMGLQVFVISAQLKYFSQSLRFFDKFEDRLLFKGLTPLRIDVKLLIMPMNVKADETPRKFLS